MIIYTDGACFGNPGPMGIGIVFFKGGKIVKRISQSIGNGTNNIAEYMAVLVALQEAKKMGEKNILLRADSELLIKQLNGEYKVKAKHLKQLYGAVISLAKELNVKFEWVEREKNKIADRLSKRAIEEDCPQHKEEKEAITTAACVQKFKIQFSPFDIYELTVERKNGFDGKMIQGTPPIFIDNSREMDLFEKLGINNKIHLFYWFYNEEQKEFPLMVVRESGIYLYSVDSEMEIRRITEKDFPAHISSQPKLNVKIEIGKLALTLGGKTKEKTGKENPEPEKLLELPEILRNEIDTTKSDKEKIEFLWNFVKQGGELNLEWEEGFPPATIEQFLFSKERERKGDCTDFSILTYAFGRELGLDINLISIRVAKTLENGTLDPKGHSFCVVKYPDGYYIIDGAKNRFGFYKGSLDDVVDAYIKEIFPGHHILGNYRVSSDDNQIKGLYMAEFGGLYKNTEWLEQALEYGYDADYVYFALAYFNYITYKSATECLAYLGKINNKDEYSLWLEGVLHIELMDFKRAEKIGLNLTQNYPEFILGYGILQDAYEKQGDFEKYNEIKMKVSEKWPK
ncbi:MAG: reverse transcriptase-like protein [Candidatus Anstonellales archaeon]